MLNHKIGEFYMTKKRAIFKPKEKKESENKKGKKQLVMKIHKKSATSIPKLKIKQKKSKKI